MTLGLRAIETVGLEEGIIRGTLWFGVLHPFSQLNSVTQVRMGMISCLPISSKVSSDTKKADGLRKGFYPGASEYLIVQFTRCSDEMLDAFAVGLVNLVRYASMSRHIT